MSILSHFKIGDLLIIMITVILTIVLTFIVLKSEILGDERIIEISINGESTTYKYGVTDSDIIEIEYADQKGYVIFESGKVKIKPMSIKNCPNQICSKTGWIEKSKESIICLPNKIIITIKGSTNEPVDIISY